jgi:hypothetical protein
MTHVVKSHSVGDRASTVLTVSIRLLAIHAVLKIVRYFLDSHSLSQIKSKRKQQNAKSKIKKKCLDPAFGPCFCTEIDICCFEFFKSADFIESEFCVTYFEGFSITTLPFNSDTASIASLIAPAPETPTTVAVVTITAFTTSLVTTFTAFTATPVVVAVSSLFSVIVSPFSFSSQPVREPAASGDEVESFGIGAGPIDAGPTAAGGIKSSLVLFEGGTQMMSGSVIAVAAAAVTVMIDLTD